VPCAIQVPTAEAAIQRITIRNHDTSRMPNVDPRPDVGWQARRERGKTVSGLADMLRIVGLCASRFGGSPIVCPRTR